MRCLQIGGLVALGWLATISLPAHAGPDGTTPAARLAAALGGTLDSDIGEAGALSQPIDYGSIVVHAGRSIEYRRRVALERELTAQSAVAPIHVAVNRP